MASLNKIILIGHLGRDPEVRFTSSGEAVCNLNIATSERFKDKAGEQRESNEWHRVGLYRRQAEIARDYLKKGSLVYVEGSLKTRKWTDKNGQERYSTEIEGREMKMLGAGGETAQQATSSLKNTGHPPPQKSPANSDKDQGNAEWEDFPF